MRIMLPVIVSLMILPMPASADGLDSLIEVGRGQAEIQNAYAAETKAYERVKKGVDEGIVVKGKPMKEIRDRYGEPVISYVDFDTKRETWVYKPAKTDFLGEGIKVRIYFDSNGTVEEVAVSEQAEGKK